MERFSFLFFYFSLFQQKRSFACVLLLQRLLGDGAEASLRISHGEVAVRQHSRHCPGGRSQRRRPTERSLGDQHDSGRHQKKEPAGMQPDSFLGQFKIISEKGSIWPKYLWKIITSPTFRFLTEGKKCLSLENNYSKHVANSFACFVQTVHLRSWRARAK